MIFHPRSSILDLHPDPDPAILRHELAPSPARNLVMEAPVLLARIHLLRPLDVRLLLCRQDGLPAAAGGLHRADPRPAPTPDLRRRIGRRHPPPGGPGKPTLLYSHGNAEDLGGVVPLLSPWHDQGFGIFAYDYPGYGQSTGKPTEASCERAIEAAWSHLTESSHVAPATIVVVGRSVGSGPAVWLCTGKQPAGLVLISPMMSVYRVRLPAPIFPGDRFPNLDRMPDIHCPLLVVHGEADSIIRPRHGQRLHQAHPGPDKTLLLIPGAGHNNLFRVGGDEIEQAILGFAERCSR